MRKTYENENKNNKNSYIIDSAFEFCVGAKINTIEVFKKKSEKNVHTIPRSYCYCVCVLHINRRRKNKNTNLY